MDLPAADTQPICPYFYTCGGCDTQDISYRKQVEYKDRWLQQLFEEFTTLWKPFLASPDAYPIYFRGKIRFGFIAHQGTIWPSRHSKQSEEADIPADQCYLQSKRAMQIALWCADFAAKHDWPLYRIGSGEGWLKHILIREGKQTGECLVSLVTTEGKIPAAADFIQAITQAFPFLTSLYQTETAGKDNSRSLDTLLWGQSVIHEIVGQYTFQISPHAFFQTNAAMVETLYETIKESSLLTGEQIIWDLYAGSATIGLYLSRLAREVVSIESNPQNIIDAEANISLNQRPNVRIVPGTVEEVCTSQFITSEAAPEIIIVDPPRAGLSDTLVRLLPHISKHRLIYVSCNPLTCLRDLRKLARLGYRIESLQGVDMFPHTLHCEMIAVLSNRS